MLRVAAAFVAGALALPAAGQSKGFSPADAAELSASVVNGRLRMNQQTANLAMRLGRERNIEALDHLLSLGQPELVQSYGNAARSPEPSPAIERRLLRIYDEPRMAVGLIWALQRYETPELAERLLRDVAELANSRRVRARSCRLVAHQVAAGDPRRGSMPGGSFGITAPRTTIRLDCPASMEPEPPHALRRDHAILLVGETDLPGIDRKLAPLIPALAAMPPIDDSAKDLRGVTPRYGIVGSLKSIAGLMGRQRYQPAGRELIAVLDALPGTTPGDFEAAWPILRALVPMDLREGTETIARWAELRSRTTFSKSDMYPALREMVSILAPILPEGHIDLSGVRDRVLANLGSDPAREQVRSSFRYVESAHAGLRDPRPGELVQWSRQNDFRMVRYLIGRGVPLDGRNAEGETALTVAIPAFWEMQKLLVEAGANPNLGGRGGETPFHLSVGAFPAPGPDRFRAVEYYRVRGADVNQMTGERMPLHTAAYISADLVGYLLVNGARIDARARSGVTPLHVAVLQGKLDIAEFLLKHGADVNAEVADHFGDGLRPVQMARDANNAKMEALLVRHGGVANPVYMAKRQTKRAVGTVVGVLLMPWLGAH